MTTIVWTGVFAFVLTVATGGVWAGILNTNLRTSAAIPWAPAVMCALLWAMWSFLDGRWGPRGSRSRRHAALRGIPVSPRVFWWATAAGVCAIVSLAGLWIVLFRVSSMPGNALPDFSVYPMLTLAAVLAASALVSSVAEEAGFRGYFQSALESRVPAAAAIVIQAIAIAPGHALTQGFVWPTVVFYFFVDAMLGSSAYLTKSILPGIAVHSLGLLTFFLLIWPQDRYRARVNESGADAWLWIHVAQAVCFAIVAIAAYRHIAKLQPRYNLVEAGKAADGPRKGSNPP